MSSESDSGSGCGCIGLALGIVALWALVFGVTIGGHHYGISGCDVEHGVKVDL